MKKFLNISLTMLIGLSMPGAWAMKITGLSGVSKDLSDDTALDLVIKGKFPYGMERVVEPEVDPVFQAFVAQNFFENKQEATRESMDATDTASDNFPSFWVDPTSCSSELRADHVILNMPEAETSAVEYDDTRTVLPEVQESGPVILERIEVNGPEEKKIEVKKQVKVKKLQKKKTSLTRIGVLAGLGLTTFGVIAKVCGKKWKLGKFFDACSIISIVSGPVVAATAYGVEKSGALEKAENMARDFRITANKVSESVEKGKKVVDFSKRVIGISVDTKDGISKDIKKLKEVPNSSWDELARFKDIEKAKAFEVQEDDFSREVKRKKFCVRKIEEARNERGIEAVHTDEYLHCSGFWEFSKKALGRWWSGESRK